MTEFIKSQIASGKPMMDTKEVINSYESSQMHKSINNLSILL